MDNTAMVNPDAVSTSSDLGENVDDQIVRAIKALNKLPTEIERFVQFAGDDAGRRAAARKATQWLESHREEIEDRKMSLSKCIGQKPNGKQKVLLKWLLQPLDPFEEDVVSEECAVRETQREVTGKADANRSIAQNLRHRTQAVKTARAYMQQTPLRGQDAVFSIAASSPHAGHVPTYTKPSTATPMNGKATFLKACGVLVKRDDVWYELACDVCNGNTSIDTGEYLQGVRAFQYHLRDDHGQEITVDDVWKRLILREVNEQEVKDVDAGRAYIMSRKCQDSGGLATMARKPSPQTSSTAVKTPKTQPKTPGSHSVTGLTTKQLKAAWERFVTVPECPVIVQVNGRDFHELRCPVCGGNARSNGDSFLQGAKAFAKHSQMAHERLLGLEEVLQECSRGVLTKAEVDKYRKQPTSMLVWRCSRDIVAVDEGGEDGEGSEIDM